MFDALVLWVHMLAATAFIGPQIFLAAVAMPALRGLDDARARQQAVRGITRGFGMLGGAALALLIATGLWNYYAEPYNTYIEDRGRYFDILNIKLTLVTLVIVLTALHAGVFGRRMQKLQEQGASDDEIAGARRWSMLMSMGTLAASVGILLCAALLSSDWGRSG
jgi:uncharacterized membrane protein